MVFTEDVKVVSAESSVAVARATEKFIDLLVNKAYHTCISHNRKTLKFEGKADLDYTMECHATYFLYINYIFMTVYLVLFPIHIYRYS
jgi:hypothetical protein